MWNADVCTSSLTQRVVTAVHMQVAEQRLLPAAERIEGHRHGNRHVDADHADLDLVLELACRAT